MASQASSIKEGPLAVGPKKSSHYHQEGFYAVKSGKRGGVRRCIFLFWEDARHFVDDDDVDGDDDENAGDGAAAFFPTMEGAVAWLLRDQRHRADGAAASGSDSDAEGEAEGVDKSDGSDADVDAGKKKKKRRGAKRGRPPRREPEESDEESDEELDYEPERWAKRMEQLRRYKANFGACDVPKDYPVIGRWAQRQRNAYLRTYGKTKAKQMEAEAAAAAEAAGEVAAVPTKTAEKEFFKEPLQYDKVLELRKLGFDFEIRNVTTLESVVRGTPRGGRKKRGSEDVEKVEEWERMFERYRNRTPGPLNEDVNRWVRKQKLQYANLVEGKPSRLSHGDRLRRLQDMGFDFERRTNKSFEESLQDFVEHVRVNGPDAPFEGRLHGWVKSMRTAAHAFRGGRETSRSKLTPEKMRMLEEVGFPFKTNNRPCLEETITWDERFLQILAYKEEHGHMRVPKREPGGLGMWCFTQRQEYRLTSTGKRKLTAERVAKNQRLAEAGFEWSLK